MKTKAPRKKVKFPTTPRATEAPNASLIWCTPAHSRDAIAARTTWTTQDLRYRVVRSSYEFEPERNGFVVMISRQTATGLLWDFLETTRSGAPIRHETLAVSLEKALVHCRSQQVGAGRAKDNSSAVLGHAQGSHLHILPKKTDNATPSPYSQSTTASNRNQVPTQEKKIMTATKATSVFTSLELAKLFIQFGFDKNAVAQWTDKKLINKAKKIHDLADKLDEGVSLTKDVRKTLDRLLEQIDAEADISIDNGDESPTVSDLKDLADDAPAPEKKGKKAMAAEPAEKASKEKGAASNGKPAKDKPAEKAPKDKPASKPGIIATIADIVEKSTKKNPAVKEEILDILVKKFPDRNPDSLSGTLNAYLPRRLRRDKGWNIVRDTEKKGTYYIAKK